MGSLTASRDTRLAAVRSPRTSCVRWLRLPIRSPPSRWARSLRAGIPGSQPFAPRVPLASAGSACPSDRHLEHAGEEDVEQADGNEELPRQRLQLVLTQARIREPHP